MRRWITAGTAAALLVFGGGGATLAQDDTGGGDLPDKRVEIPDAGLSIALPDDYELSVTPEGRVFGSSSYGPELLDCADG